MAKTNYASIDDYIAAHPAATQHALQRVRETIRKAVPDAQEVISYQIAAFKLHGQPVLFFAGWKEHYSLYPANARLVAAFEQELAPYEVNNKGTIRFPLDEPVPTKLVAALAKFRAKEVTTAAAAKQRATAKKKAARKKR